MSDQQNLQIVKDAYAAFGRRDIPTVLKALTDDVEWTIPGEGVFRSGVFTMAAMGPRVSSRSWRRPPS